MERGGGRFPAAHIRDRNNVMGIVCGDEESAGLGGSPVEGVYDQALVGSMLERGRGLVGMSTGRSQVRLRMGQRMQLRRAAGEGQRECEEQSEEKDLHGAIIHSPRMLPKTPTQGYLAPARHWSRPAMNRSLGSFLPMNTITDSFFSPLAQGLPTSPPIIMCTPWNTTRFGLPFIHSTPL